MDFECDISWSLSCVFFFKIWIFTGMYVARMSDQILSTGLLQHYILWHQYVCHTQKNLNETEIKVTRTDIRLNYQIFHYQNQHCYHSLNKRLSYVTSKKVKHVNESDFLL